MDETVRISEENSAATQQVSAQMEQIVALANGLLRVAETLQQIMRSFDLSHNATASHSHAA